MKRSNLFLFEFLDEEYKGRFYPVITNPIDNKIEKIPLNYDISFYNIISEDILSSPIENVNPNIRKQYEDALVNGKHSKSKILLIYPQNSHERFMLLQKTNFTFLQVFNIEIDFHSRLLYFILEPDMANDYQSDLQDTDVVNTITSLHVNGSNVWFEIDSTVTLIKSNESNIMDYLYIHNLELIVDMNGTVIGTGNLQDNTIVNFSRKIYIKYVKNIEGIGFHIPGDMIVEFASGKSDLYSTLAPFHTRFVLLFKVQSNNEPMVLENGNDNPKYNETISLITSSPDFSKNYKIIASSWLNFYDHESPKVYTSTRFSYGGVKFAKMHNSLMKKYGMKPYLPNIESFNARDVYTKHDFIENKYILTSQDLNSDRHDCFQNFETYIRDDPMNIDQYFIDRMLTNEILLRFLPEPNVNRSLFAEMDIDELNVLHEFNGRVRQITESEEFVAEYLEKRGYPRDIVKDKPVYKTYFDFLKEILTIIDNIKIGKYNPKDFYNKKYINTLRFLIKNTDYLNRIIVYNEHELAAIIETGDLTRKFISNGYELATIIENSDLDLFKYIFDNDLVGYYKNNQQHALKRVLINVLRSSENPEMLDYLVNKFDLKLKESYFYEARGRTMILHLINNYNLPGGEYGYSVKYLTGYKEDEADEEEDEADEEDEEDED